MKFSAKLLTFYGIVLCLASVSCADGKHGRLRLRPLSAQEVYRVLREYGEEDAVPQGRVVSQGIAAIKGFALGLTKGIGGALLVDVATSNATLQYLNSLNISALTSGLPTIPTLNVSALTNSLPTFNVTGWTDSIPTINMTALIGMLKPGLTTTTATQAPPSTQEICFSSRSLNGYDGRNLEPADDEEAWARDNLRAGTTTPTTGTLTTSNVPTGTTPTGTSTSTNTESSSPDDTKVTCIVLQKSARRRRRRRSFY